MFKKQHCWFWFLLFGGSGLLSDLGFVVGTLAGFLQSIRMKQPVYSGEKGYPHKN